MTENETTNSAGPVRRRPRHLLDPEDIRGSHQRSIGTQQSLTGVQRGVMSILVVVTLLHLAGGFAVAAVFIDEDALDARVGLNVLAAIVGIAAVVAGLLIHGRRPLSPWLLLGLLPALAGLWFTFR